MTQIGKLIFIGICSGAVLASLLLLIYVITNNQAYILLFNTDYIPLLKNISSSTGGIIFHFTFCIVSVLLLFYILKLLHREYQLTLYILVYTVGSAILFFLTIFTDKPPHVTDMFAWLYWTLAHGIYALIVGFLIKRWI